MRRSHAHGAIWDALDDAARRHGDRPAVVWRDESWSLAQLLAAADALGAWLDGAVRGGPVLYVPENTPASVAFILAAIGGGHVPVLADPAWTDHELLATARRCGAGALAWHAGTRSDRAGAVAHGTLRLLRVDREPAGVPDGTALGRFTSGTSGAPRCLAFSETAVLNAAKAWSAAAGYAPGDRVLCLATLNNGLAFNASLLAVLLHGASLRFHHGRLVRSSILRSLALHRPTVLVAFPFVYDQLVTAAAAGDALAELRLAVSSAARLSPETKGAWAGATSTPLCDYYGVAEVGPCTFAAAGSGESLGGALAGVELRVTARDGTVLPSGREGRIRVRTASMATDFLDRDEPRLAASIDGDGFFVTQDVGRLSADGRLFLTRRVGGLVNIEGRKIEPREVETVIAGLPRVRDVAVCGRRIARRTVLAAYVEADGLSREDIVDHCRSRLAAYKVPELVRVLDALPRSSTGKPSLGRLQALEDERTRA